MQTDVDARIRKVLIVGGGSAGWMTAAALANALQTGCQIELVESDDIGTIGVGEATIPPIKLFNQTLGLDEAEFMKRTQGSFKLGIQFHNWGRLGQKYFHPFGPYGRNFDTVPLYQHWLAQRAGGRESNLDDLCMAGAMAREGRFVRPSSDQRHVLSTFDYAYHFDAGLYARYLREYAQARGVRRTEGRITRVETDADSGYVTRVRLEGDRFCDADLFIDCSGFRALLIEETLQVGFENWSHWLPCDSAFAVPCKRGDFTPYTRSTAHSAGWQWRIPLQHRTGNGHVFSSAFMSNDEASDILMQNLDGEALADPRLIRFVSGRRRKFWDRNVVAIGLSGGFVEPLESTALHLIQAGIAKLIALFPDRNFHPAVIREYNRIAIGEIERIRDFLILHYHLASRDDAEMWRYCARMDIPDSLRDRIELFQAHGLLVPRDLDLFGQASWLAVFVGQGAVPNRSDPLLDFRQGDSASTLIKMREAMTAAALSLPTHAQFIDKYCPAN